MICPSSKPPLVEFHAKLLACASDAQDGMVTLVVSPIDLDALATLFYWGEDAPLSVTVLRA